MAGMKQDRNIVEPPRWADQFFKWYCNEDLQEELLGDLYERFYEQVENSGARWAKLWYWINVFLFINKYTLRRSHSSYARTNHFDMFQNYLKTGWRNITKNGLATFINAVGLAMAIGCCLVVFTFVDWSFNTDSMHSLRDEIYVVERWVDQDGHVSLWGNSPEGIGPALKADFPQVANAVRVKHDNGIMKKGDQVFNEQITFVDSSFYELFDFPVKYGQVEDFMDPDGIVLIENIAEKYFGYKDPTGETISIRFKTDEKEVTAVFTVKGVLANRFNGATFFVNSLLPYQKQAILGKTDFEDWGETANITFLHLPNAEDLETIQAGVAPYTALANKADKKWTLNGFNFQPLKHITLHSFQVNYSMFFTTHIAGFIMLGLIALSLLTLVCFNYMNIAIASASTRLKEISVRKVIGGSRKQVIVQFLTENLVVCLLAIVLGIFLAQTIFLPWFNDFGQIEFEFGFFENPRLWMMIFGLVIVAALGGAGYPALYISRLDPNHIFKQKTNLGSKNRFRKILLGVQFFLTFITLFSAIAFLIEAEAIRSKSWGYRNDNIVNLSLQKGGDYSQLSQRFLQEKDVLDVTGSAHPLGKWHQRLNIEVADKTHSLEGMVVEHNYLDVMGIELLDGRTFDPNKELDQENALIVNEAFRKRMNWKEAVGEEVKIDEEVYHVIGEVRNFYFDTFDEQIKPMVIRNGQPADFKYLAIRTTPNELESMTKSGAVIWQQQYPDLPYDYFFQDAVFDQYFMAYHQVSSLLKATSILTIIISGMGLFGLAMLLLARRMKEISIRKVLGADMTGLSWEINREFFITIFIASILAAPVGSFLMSSLLGQVNAEPVSFGPFPYIMAVVALVIMTLVSISRHIYRLAISDPTKYLRDE